MLAAGLGSVLSKHLACRPDVSASSRSLVGTLETAAMTRSLPEQEVLKYLSHGQPLVGAEGSVMTNTTSRCAMQGWRPQLN